MKYFTISKTSNLIGVSRMTIYNWIKSGKIDFIEINGGDDYFSYAIPENEIDKKTKADKAIVRGAIEGTFKQYGPVLDKLADE